MLQSQSRALDLALLGTAAQLMGQLVALRKAGRAQRMTLAEQTARRIGDDFAAVGVVAVFDEALGATHRAKTQALIGQQFILRKAVMQLADVNVVGANAGSLVDFLAAAAVIWKPTRSIMDLDSKVEPKSVVMSCASI